MRALSENQLAECIEQLKTFRATGLIGDHVHTPRMKRYAKATGGNAHAAMERCFEPDSCSPSRKRFKSD